jgi:hypothetical protein
MNQRATGRLLDALRIPAILLWASGCGVSEAPDAAANPSAAEERPVLSPTEVLGCHFSERAEQAPLDAVRAESIVLPDFPGYSAIWGATGRDRQGHIWFGVSGCDVEPPSAHLLEYDPATQTLQDRGDVMAELRRLGIARAGERQVKIHSRIVHGEDGHLYFASMDEEGEKTDGSRLPSWGSHLWRLRLPDYYWEHLLAAPEGLIAVSSSGRWIYALGYFHHVLYQYDCRTAQVRSVTVGAEGGHISRNFFCDLRGHVYVPRLARAEDKDELVVTLVELDHDLQQVGESPLAHYTVTMDDQSHGITGIQPLADQSVAFITDQGRLYHLTPRAGQPADVQDLGWFHPQGKVYMASLFSADGERNLLGASRRPLPEGQQWEWLVYDLTTGSSRATPLALPDHGGQPLPQALLYGSITRDNTGACYLVGMFHRGKDIPFALRVRDAAGARLQPAPSPTPAE